MWDSLLAPDRLRRSAVVFAAVVIASLGASWAAMAAPPDRAYEKVSPADKNGNDAAEDGAWASALGDAVVWASVASFGDQPSAPLTSFYLSRREPPSWTTTGISPPMAPVPAGNVGDPILVSDDALKSVAVTSAVLTPSAAPDMQKLYVHDHTTHTYKLVTPPPVPPSTTTTDNVIAIDASPDLTHVLFETDAELTADAVGVTGSKLYHWVDDGTDDGAVTLASVLPSGAGAAGTAGSSPTSAEPIKNSIADNGSAVFFTSPVATSGRVYRRAGSQTVRVNEEENPGLTVDCDAVSASVCAAVFRAASTDGTKVFFTSNQQLVADDTNTVADLYMYTHSADPAADNNLRLLSPDAEPDAPVGANVQGVIGTSDDGTKVYFVANNQIVDDADATAPRKLYVVDTSTSTPQVRYIGALATGDSAIWTNTGAAATRRRAYVAPDGRHLLVTATGQIVPSNSGGLRQAYLYRFATNSTVCISCPATDPPVAPADLYSGSDLFNPRGRRNVSNDGTRAYFQTATPLVSGDVNGDVDVYMYEAGAAQLVSTGRADGPSVFVDASSSGDDIFFTTPQQLSGWDKDALADVYDARLGGGLPEPPPGQGVTCSGDECQGPAGANPSFSEPGSSLFRGPADVSPGARPEFVLGRLSRSARVRFARTGRVTIRVRVNRPGRVSAVARVKLGGKSRIVGRASRRARRPGVVALSLKLPNAAKRRLQRRGTRKVAIEVRFAGVREPAVRTLRLRPARVHADAKGR